MTTSTPLWLAVVGATAGSVVSRLAEAPFVRCKQIVQAQAELLRQGMLGRPMAFGGEADLMAVVRHVVRTEGVLGLLRGTPMNVLAALPTTLVSFLFYDLYTSWLASIVPNIKDQRWVACYIKAPLIGVTTMALTYPLTLVQTVQMAEVLDPELGHSTYQFPSASAVWSRTIQRSGFFGLFRGFSAGAAHIWLSRACSFIVWDLLKEKLGLTPNKPRDELILLTASTVLSTLVAHPLDTIRRRTMVAAPTPLAYNGSIECALTIWREEGLNGFFHGVIFSIIRSLVSAIVAFYVGKLVKKLLTDQPGL